MKHSTKEMIAVLQAYEQGKTIQTKGRGSKDIGWWDNLYPNFNFESFDYRVKPDAKPGLRKFVIQGDYYGDGSFTGAIVGSEAEHILRAQGVKLILAEEVGA